MSESKKIDETIARRTVLGCAIAAVVLGGPLGRVFAAASGGKASDSQVTIEKFDATGKSMGTERVAKVSKSDADWRRQLSADSYRVTRRDGTEPPDSGKYADYHGDGIYRCICCDNALFDSKTKFESGTGWPSFWKPISRRNVSQTADYSLLMRREAISCTLCDAHLGHVFDDGPRPTGLRYCMNSVALNFTQRA